MGVGQRKSKGNKGGHKTKNKQYKKGHATKNRRKDVDQIQDELKVEEEKREETKFEIDDDLPGQGQFYCTPCARHFTDEQTRAVHIKSKLHKRRMKDVAQEQYTQEEAERGAGMTREKHPPAHPPSSLSMTPNIEKPDVAGDFSSRMDVGDPEQEDPDL